MAKRILVSELPEINFVDAVEEVQSHPDDRYVDEESDPSDDPALMNIDQEDSHWEFDEVWEFEAPQFCDLSSEQTATLGRKHIDDLDTILWFRKTHTYHEPKNPPANITENSTGTPTMTLVTPPRTPGRSKIAPLGGLSQFGSPMRVPVAPVSDVPATPTSPLDIKPPTVAFMDSPAMRPIKRTISALSSSPLGSPRRVIIKSPGGTSSSATSSRAGSRKPSPASPAVAVATSSRAVQRIPAASKTTKPVIASVLPTTSSTATSAKTTPTTTPITTAASTPTSNFTTPTPGSYHDPTSPISTINSTTADTPTLSTPLSMSYSWTSPTSFSAQLDAASPTSTLLSDSAPSSRPASASSSSSLGGGAARVPRLGTAVRVVASEPADVPIEDLAIGSHMDVDQEFCDDEENMNPLVEEHYPPSIPTKRLTPTSTTSKVAAVRMVHVASRYATSNSSISNGGGAKRVAAPTTRPPVVASQKITRRAGPTKVEFTAAPAALTQQQAHSLSSRTTSGVATRKPGAIKGKGIELDDNVAKLLAEHNKKFVGAKTTYEPRKFGVKEIREWERKSGLQWYDLNAAERTRANEEIEQMREEARMLQQH